MIAHKVPKTLLCPISVHEVIKIFQAGRRIAHINDGNALSSLIQPAPDSFIVPVIPCTELRGIRFLCVNQHSIVKGTLIKPCHTGQQTFPFSRGFCVLLYRLFVEVGKDGRFTQAVTSISCSDFQSKRLMPYQWFHPTFQNPHFRFPVQTSYLNFG